MIPPALPESPPGELLPENLVEVGCYRTAAQGFEHGLVVLAAGWAYWLVPAETGYRLLVEVAAEAEVRGQLAKFERESLVWPPRLAGGTAAGGRADWFTPLLWALATIAGFWAQGRWPALTEAGAVEAGAIFRRGEVWRAATALFLHADAAHLAANLISGVFVFAAVLATIGRRRGWWLIAGASVAGNLAAAALRAGVDYRSIGASTAVFASVGLLTGRAVRIVATMARPWRWRAMIVPLAAGVGVLGLFGAGGVEIDVLAHATGFASGLALGAIATRAPR